MINYYLLTKPGIIMGNLITLFAGFMLAGQWDTLLFLKTLIGLALVIASAGVFNNYIDRERDRKMERTKSRPLASGAISSIKALIFGTITAFVGFAILSTINFLTLALSALGFFTYVVLYSIWKGKTIYGTAIGSISGALPPVIGYCAASNQLDMGGFILFAIMVFWQMAHFFSIAILHLEDYKKAEIPVFPALRGMVETKVRMAFYIAGFIIAALSLTLFHYTGVIYFIMILLSGSLWFLYCLRGFYSLNDQLWSRNMFRISLIVIGLLSITITF